MFVDTFTRVSALSLSRHLPYRTANGSITFVCFSRRCAHTYFRTLIFTYVCHYYVADIDQHTKLYIFQYSHIKCVKVELKDPLNQQLFHTNGGFS